MLNFFVYTGFLTAQPKQNYTSNGAPYILFRLASQREFRSGSRGYLYDFVQFHAVGHTAELFLRYVKVGQCVTVRGRLASGQRHEKGKDYPFEMKLIDRVYFDKLKSPRKDLDPAEQERVEFIAKHDGFDENGAFPKEEQ